MKWRQSIYKLVRSNFSTKALALVMAFFIYYLVNGMITSEHSRNFAIAFPTLNTGMPYRIEIQEPENGLCFFTGTVKQLSVEVTFEGPNSRIGELQNSYEIVGQCRIPSHVLEGGEPERILRVGFDSNIESPDVLLVFDKWQDLSFEMSPPIFPLKVVRKKETPKTLPPAINFEEIQKKAAHGMVLSENIVFEPSKLTVTGPAKTVDVMSSVELELITPLPDNSLTSDTILDLRLAEDLRRKRVAVSEKPIRMKLKISSVPFQKLLEVRVNILALNPISQGLNVVIPREEERVIKATLVGPEEIVSPLNEEDIIAFVNLEDLGERSIGHIPVYYRFKRNIEGVEVTFEPEVIAVERKQ